MGTLYGVQVAAVNSVGTGSYSGTWAYGTPAGEVYLVSQTSDEAHQNSSGTVTTGTTPGMSVATNEYVAWRFQNITAAQAAVAAKASLILTSVTGTTDAGTAWCEAADNAATFTTTTNAISNLSKTSDSAAFGTLGSTWTAIDVHAPVQDVFNRGGWASGHALAFILEVTSGSTDIYSYANGGGNQPVLLLVPGSAVAKTSTIPVEPNLSVAQAPTLPVESKGSLAANPTLPVESELSVHAPSTLPVEASLSVKDVPAALPLESQLSVDAVPAAPVEWREISTRRRRCPSKTTSRSRTCRTRCRSGGARA